MPQESVVRWREQLESLAVPEEILRRAAEPPWTFPVEMFRRRAERAREAAETPSSHRAREALSEGGSVLDVGSGAGAGSLALVPPAGRIVAVDESEEMLAAFRELASAAGVDHREVAGRWPDVAPEVEAADVVVCHHVLYNVADLPPFAEALTRHARRRVVVEMTDRHPTAGWADLWTRFHGLARPTGPVAEDAVAALRELGLEIHAETFDPPVWTGFRSRPDLVAAVRRRLCLPPDRDAEVEEALASRLVQRDGGWSLVPREGRRMVAVWWDA